MDRLDIGGIITGILEKGKVQMIDNGPSKSPILLPFSSSNGADFTRICADTDRLRRERHELVTIPQQLYDSEISFTITCFWDNGFQVSLGIAPNFNESATVPTYLAACRWLKEAACRHYPASEFANRYGSGLGLV